MSMRVCMIVCTSVVSIMTRKTTFVIVTVCLVSQTFSLVIV